jgi:hypothetical protein
MKSAIHPNAAGWFSSLAQIAEAHLVNSARLLTAGFYNVFKAIPTLSTSFEVPVASFAFQGLTETQEVELTSLGLRKEVARPNVFIGTPGASSIPSIFSYPITEARTNPGTVSADGYLAYIYMTKAFMFFSEISYTLFSGAGLNNIVGYSAGDQRDTLARPLGSSPVAEGIDLAKQLASGEQFCRSLIGAIATPSIFGKVGQFTGLFSSMSAPKFKNDKLDGLFFPYFDGMLTTDKSLCDHVFKLLFFKSLAGNHDEARKLYSRIRNGIRNLATHRAGKVFSHLFAGILIAYETHSIITAMVENGVYHGFVIQSPGLVATIGGSTFKAVSFAELLLDLGSLNKQEKLLTDIVGLINGLVNDSGMPVYKFQATDINTSRKFMQVWSSINLDFSTSTTFLADVRKLVDQLLFGDKFALPGNSSILAFLKYVQTGDMTLLAEYPAFLQNGVFLQTDRITVGLSIFGARVPSVNYGKAKDQTFTIPGSADAADPNLAVTDGKRPLRYLPFKTEPIFQAAVQWKNLFDSGRLLIPHGRKGKDEFTSTSQVTLRIAGDPHFANTYGLIKAISISSRNANRQGKRARDEGTEENKASSKRAKKGESIRGLL